MSVVGRSTCWRHSAVRGLPSMRRDLRPIQTVWRRPESQHESTAIRQVLVDAVIYLCPGASTEGEVDTVRPIWFTGETCSHPDRILKLCRTAGDRYPTTDHILVPSDESSAVTPQPLESSVHSILWQPKTTASSWRLVHGSVRWNVNSQALSRQLLRTTSRSQWWYQLEKNWKWTDKADKIFYQPDSTLKKLPVGSWMQFQFKEWRKWHSDIIFATTLNVKPCSLLSLHLSPPRKWWQSWWKWGKHRK